MIALLTTYFILAYILIPGVLFRVFAGFLVKLRLFQLTRTQEVTIGVLVSLAPLIFANFFVWTVPFAENHPLPYTFGTTDEYKRDYRLVLSLAVSTDPEKLLEPVNGVKSVYEQANDRIWRRQVRFLCWYYVLSGTEGLLFGYLARRYGDWSGRNVVYDWLARKILLPNISESQLLLTDFTFPKKPKRDVLADVLCQEIVYRGKVGDYFLDTNGKLSGLFMKDVERFRRKEYEVACDQANGNAVDSEDFWKEIPGSNFYIPADQISNLNVRFPLLDKDFEAFINNLISNLELPSGTTASFKNAKTEASEESQI